MSIAAKIILATLGAGIVYGIIHAKKVIDRFTFNIAGYGLPKLNDWVLTLPVIIRFNNPAPFAVNLDRFEANIFLFQGNTWQQVARIDQPLKITAGESEKTITAKIDLASIFNKNIFSTLRTALLTSKIQLRTDINAVVSGIELPTQTDTTEIDLRNAV